MVLFLVNYNLSTYSKHMLKPDTQAQHHILYSVERNYGGQGRTVSLFCSSLLAQEEAFESSGFHHFLVRLFVWLLCDIKRRSPPRPGAFQSLDAFTAHKLKYTHAFWTLIAVLLSLVQPRTSLYTNTNQDRQRKRSVCVYVYVLCVALY